MKHFGSIGFSHTGAFRASLCVDDNWKTVEDAVMTEVLRSLYELLKSGAQSGMVAGQSVRVVNQMASVSLAHGLLKATATVKSATKISWCLEATFLKGGR